jgi:hypothetical protein
MKPIIINYKPYYYYEENSNLKFINHTNLQTHTSQTCPGLIFRIN